MMDVNSTAKGLWKNDEDHLEHDEVIVVEVMADDIDKDWWAAFRADLETLLSQDEIVAGQPRSSGSETVTQSETSSFRHGTRR